MMPKNGEIGVPKWLQKVKEIRKSRLLHALGRGLDPEWVKFSKKSSFLGWPTSPKCGKYIAKSMLFSLASIPFPTQF